MLATTPEEASARRQLYEPTGTFLTYFIGEMHGAPDGPQGFLVENPPDYVVKPHFHGVNQFQLIVDGDGMFGKHALRPGSLHYSDAYTPYGPIEAGPDGLSWFTLRQHAYHGMHEMPGSRHLMKGKAGRNAHTDIDVSIPPSASRSVLVAEPDGLRVVQLGAPSRAAFPEAGVSQPHHGAYIVVLAGSVLAAGTEYPVNTCLHVERDSALPALESGEDGGVVAVLAFGPDVSSGRE